MPGAGPHSHEGTRPFDAAVTVQLAGAGLILIGVFAPWIRSHALFLTIPVRGAETDYGRLYPAIAFAVLALLAYQWSLGWRRWAHGVIVLLGVVALAAAVLYGVQVAHRVHRVAIVNRNRPGSPLALSGGVAFSFEFDIGYYVTLLGAGGLVAGGIVGLRRSGGNGA